LKRGRAVRALVRSIDERADALRDLGIEIVVGDYGNYRSLVGASTALKLLISATPSLQALRRPQDSSLLRGESRGSSVSWTFRLQQLEWTVPVRRGEPNGWQEQIFEWAGFSGVHLRIAAFFMENVTAPRRK